MRMLSGRMHWLTVGLALLVSAQGFTTQTSNGQMPGGPYGMPGGLGSGGPMSMAFEGPAPMDMETMYGSGGSYDSGCDTYGNCASCGGGSCGGLGCGPLAGLRGNGPLARLRGCACGGAGCNACGASGYLFDGRLMSVLGPLAPYTEGGEGGGQRWFDIYGGTMALRRTSDYGGFSSGVQDPFTGQFQTTDVISTQGVSGPTALRTTDLDLDKLRYGLELVANLQVGPGSNLEARYFGLNNWETSKSVRVNTFDLYSAFSIYGTAPPGGFDDTDRSFLHTISYNSELHNGEINYRRRWVDASRPIQGSFLAGIRYFDLDERFGFAAVGSSNNTLNFNTLRFGNVDTHTRNQLTGFQTGGDLWVAVMPGVHIGVEGKTGIFGNHAEVETQIVSNSIPGAKEFLQDGKTAYIGELTASAVYRLTYSWSIKGSYNLLYVDNVALAPENVNTRDLSNALGGGAFTMNRFPFLDVDGEAVYQGWSVGGEFLY